MAEHRQRVPRHYLMSNSKANSNVLLFDKFRSAFHHRRRRSTVDDLQFTRILPKGPSRLSLSADSLMGSSSPLFPNYPTPFISPNELLIREEVGSGFSGIVFKAWYRPSRQLVACKTLHAFGAPEHLLGELDLVLRCKAGHLISCLGILVDNWQVSVVMEWMDCGSLERHRGKLAEPALASVCLAVLLGLRSLHTEYGIFHCDLKPSNILFNSAGQVKLCDFGESRHMHSRGASRRSTGSEAYMAPERIVSQRDNTLTPKADVWSFGVTVFELVTGRHPFDVNAALVELVETLTVESEPRLAGREASKALRDFVARCLTRDLARRASVGELLQHQFLRKALDERELAKWAREQVLSEPSFTAASVVQ